LKFKRCNLKVFL